MTEIYTSREAVNELASERDERAAESMMMAEAHRNAGAPEVASGWDAAAEAAITQAATLRTLLARAEKAERERDEAWNAAIEAAINAVNGCDRISEAQPAIRALKKGTNQ